MHQIENLDRLINYTPEELQQSHNINVLTGHEATALNLSHQTLEVRDLRQQSTRKLYYDYLVLGTGARAKRPKIEGIDLTGVFSLRHMPEARRLDSYLKNSAPRRAVIVGGGYIGLEMAEALRMRGLEVSIITESENLLRTFDGTLRDRIAEELAKQGVKLHLGEKLAAIGGRDRVERVVTNAGELEADFVLAGVGIEPDVELARGAGIRLGETGAIAVRDSQQTSVPTVYAAGDCCEAMHLVTGKPAYVPLGTTANKQGRVAGINVAGGRAIFKGIVGTMAVKVFQLEVAATGLSAGEAATAGFLPKVVEVESRSRAGYYPGGHKINTRLIYDERTGRLLGAQMVGGEDVAKRIDVVATALFARLKVEDLLQLDLSYAPPFAPVWDPILHAARKVE